MKNQKRNFLEFVVEVLSSSWEETTPFPVAAQVGEGSLIGVGPVLGSLEHLSLETIFLVGAFVIVLSLF